MRFFLLTAEGAENAEGERRRLGEGERGRVGEWENIYFFFLPSSFFPLPSSLFLLPSSFFLR
jgi:hypothetical protein